MARVKALHESIYSLGYYEYLCDIIGADQRDKSYNFLTKSLQNKKFHWSVPNDDNRVADAMQLRDDYFRGFISKAPCTVFEVLISIAIRCEEMMAEPEEGDQTAEWFWMMITNLKLDKLDDEFYYDLDNEGFVDAVLSKMLDRTYTKHGNGGLFPLKKAKKDQRKVEIWYQMCTYLVDNYHFYD